MSYQPVIPSTGIAGWTFLQRTYDAQFEAYNRTAQLERDLQYFEENIGNVTTAEALVSDRRLLSVALGAFDLSEDIDSRAFIQRILEDGTAADDALANRLSDERYRDLSDAFGFGPDASVQTGASDFADRITDLYKRQQFEIAVGQQDDTMRVALNAQHAMVDLAAEDQSTDAKWFTLMGTPPLRELMEKALGLPESINQIDVDQQLGIFKDAARQKLGSDDFAELSEPDMLEKITNAYLARSQIESVGNSTSGASIALSLLSR